MRFALAAGFEADDFVWRCTSIGVCCDALDGRCHRKFLIPRKAHTDIYTNLGCIFASVAPRVMQFTPVDGDKKATVVAFLY